MSGELLKGRTYEQIHGIKKAKELKLLRKECLLEKPRGFKKTHKINLGRKHSIEAKNKMRISALGKKMSKEARSKMSLVNGGTGVPYENSEYGAEFDDCLKEKVRFRDKYKCRLCSCPQLENRRQLDVHHIDYNKRSSNIKNLVSLCISCHLKTNHNRKYWNKYFKERLYYE